MSAILTIPPINEPVHLDQLKSYLKIDANAEDELLRAFLTTARVHLEHLTGCHLITQTWRIMLEGPLKPDFALPVQPVTQITSAVILNREGDAIDLPGEALHILSQSGPARLRQKGLRALHPFERLQIDVVTGFGTEPDDVPAPLRQAIKMIVAQWFEMRLVVEPDRIPSLKKAIQPLIEPYRSVRL